jgi:DNA polymerase-3 subunit delta'
MPFRDVVGHRRLIDLLVRSIRHDSLPPSLLFTGREGSGTRETALAVAQALNCLSPERESTSDACGQCGACARIARGIHPDVLFVEPGDTGAIKIEQVREVVERTAYRPFEGRRRVVIVDQAETMTPQTQNALLKTLEEPPSSSVFILITALPDQLLATVRSRLIRLSFADIGQVEMDRESRDVAERVLAQAAANGDRGRRLEAAKDLLVNTGAGGGRDRDQLAAHLRAMAALLRDMEVRATGADDRVLAHQDARPAVDRLVKAYRGERGIRAFAAVDKALAALEGNAGVKVVADWVVLQL